MKFEQIGRTLLWTLLWHRDFRVSL